MTASALLLALSMGAACAQAPQTKTKTQQKPPDVTDCRKLSSVAAFFGEERTKAYAETNLDRAIDDDKTRRTADGEVGFVVIDRKVACKEYIDFGGAVGVEHKCIASARLCLRSR
jgi:hypothetical protein